MDFRAASQGEEKVIDICLKRRYTGFVAYVNNVWLAMELRRGGMSVPRPRKWRRVCSLPEQDAYGPLHTPSSEVVVMSVEEYETIRLMDLEGCTQEQCAESMDVARTTVQGIYMRARKKLAEFLVSGSLLRIQGGDYRLCEEIKDPSFRRGCGRGRGFCRNKGLRQEDASCD